MFVTNSQVFFQRGTTFFFKTVRLQVNSNFMANSMKQLVFFFVSLNSPSDSFNSLWSDKHQHIHINTVWGGTCLNRPLTVTLANNGSPPQRSVDLPEKYLGKKAGRRCRVGLDGFSDFFHGEPAHSHGSFSQLCPLFLNYCPGICSATSGHTHNGGRYLWAVCYVVLQLHELAVLKEKIDAPWVAPPPQTPDWLKRTVAPRYSLCLVFRVHTTGWKRCVVFCINSFESYLPWFIRKRVEEGWIYRKDSATFTATIYSIL